MKLTEVCICQIYMLSTHVYLVPDYYREFVCKGSACRHTCCQGWAVTLSFQEYYTLIGLNCSKGLRKKLDCAFIDADNKDNERFAIIKQNWEGHCPMLMSDGLCELHKNCGEKVLPYVCRYYPRSPKFKYEYECSCSNSCEKVLEMLFAGRDKLTFEKRELTFNFKNDAVVVDKDKTELYNAIRFFCLEIMQDRKLPLKTRLYKLGIFINGANKIPYTNLKNELNVLIDKYKDMPLSNCDTKAGDCFDLQRKIAEWFEENSTSFTDYGAAIEKNLIGEDGEKYYNQAKLNFNIKFPQWEIMFENMLLNHLFYEQFPYIDGCQNIWNSYLSLCGVYTFLRYVCLGYMQEKESIDDLVDVCGAAFRVIEHSDFYKKVCSMLKFENRSTLESLLPLINS